MRRVLALVLGATLAVALTAAPAVAKGDKAPGDMTIYDIVKSDGNFSTLKAAIDAADLDAVLDGEDVQFTVFAPTNAAFEKVAGELELTLDELVGFLVAEDLLDDVLLYHVTEGRRFANSVVNKNNPKGIETLLGAFVTSTPMAKIQDAAPSTTDAAIIATNISASNGVVHVIDNVLVPLDI